MGRKRPPRLPGFDYLGCHAYFLTICAESGAPFAGAPEIANAVCVQLLRTAADYGFATIAYCLIPDHLHALVEGLEDRSDFQKFAAMIKQRTSFAYRRVSETQLWQEGYYDHVLRDAESQIGVAAYIVNNPIRAGLCTKISDYPWLGSDRYTLDELIEAVQLDPRGARRRSNTSRL
jgi:REP element-mobilizing transposase RayT